jgi:multiple sugar transport system permease protein
MSEQRRTALLALPFVAGVTLIVALPAAWAIGLAAFEWDLIGSPRFVGLGNLRELASDDIFRTSLRNTLAFVAIAVPLRLAGALGLALLLHRPRRLVGAHRTAALVPTVMPDVAYALVWLWIANPLYGPLNLSLDALGAPTPSWLTTPAAAQWLVIMMSAFTIGEGFVVAAAARAQIPGEVYEVAAIAGLSPWATFRRVTLPLLTPTLLLLAMRDAAFAFQATFVPALVVTGGGPPPFSTTYLPLFAYRNGFEYLRYGYGAAVTVAMLAVTGLVLLAQRGIVQRRLTLWS